MKLFDMYPNAVFGSQQIASVLGFSSGGGAFKSLLSDLKQYGLIEGDASGNYVISGAVKELSVAAEQDKDAIKYQLAISPKVFMQVIENQGQHLPNTVALEKILVARFGFNKAKAAKTAKALRESLEWANAIDEKGNVLNPSVRQGNLSATNAESSPPAWGIDTGQSDAIAGGDAAGVSEQRDIGIIPPPAPRQKDCCLTTDVPIGDGRIVHVEYPRDMTSDEAAKVSAVLKALTGLAP